MEPTEDIMTYIEPVLNEFGSKVVEAIKQKLISAGKGQGPLEESLSYKLEGQVFSIVALEYLQYVINGRQPGKMPPIEPIIEWANRKGIKPVVKSKKGGGTQSLEEAIKSMAYAIATKIKNEGIQPLDISSVLEPILYELPNEISKAIGPWTLKQSAAAFESAFANIPGITIKTTFN